MTEDEHFKQRLHESLRRVEKRYPSHPSRSFLFWAVVLVIILSSGQIGWTLRGLLQ